MSLCLYSLCANYFKVNQNSTVLYIQHGTIYSINRFYTNRSIEFQKTYITSHLCRSIKLTHNIITYKSSIYLWMIYLSLLVRSQHLIDNGIFAEITRSSINVHDPIVSLFPGKVFLIAGKRSRKNISISQLRFCLRFDSIVDSLTLRNQ